MKVSTMHNGKSSAATSPSEPRYKVELSEVDYLAREVEDAKQALAHAAADLKRGVATSADLRLWVKHYPWTALGAATVAGFAAGTAVTPARGESVAEKLSRLKPDGRNAETQNETNASPAAPAKSSKVQETLMDSLFDVAKTLVQTVILATVRPPAASAAQDQNVASGASTPPWQTRAG
jgi:hypothetical protein